MPVEGTTGPLMLDIPAFIPMVLDPVRLAVLGAAAVGPVDTAGLAAGLRVEERRVRHEVGRLTAAGLLRDGRLDLAVLRSLAASLPSVPDAAAAVTAGPWSAEEMRILQTFFSGNRLREIPASPAKRRVVLERLAMEFEPGRRYEEREVNVTVQMFHADHAALRRYLVDAGLMTRADGVYWRTGGRYETNPVAEPAPGE